MTQTPAHDNLDNILEDEIQSWQTFGEILKNGEEEIFTQMLNDCREFKDAIASKGSLYSTESTLMALIFVQQKMINQLIATSTTK